MVGVNDITMIESRCAECQHEMEFGLPMVDVKLRPPERDLGPDSRGRALECTFPAQPRQFRASPGTSNMTSSMASN